VTQLDHRLTGHLQVVDTEGISPMLHLQAGQHVVLRPVRPDQPFG
jgi:hypothetical protein